MTDVICDTSFLIHLYSARIHNIDSLDSEIGEISFVIPRVVLDELGHLAESNPDAARTLRSVSRHPSVDLPGGAYADAAIVAHVRRHGGIIATMDKKLKRAVRDAGGSIISISRDSVMLEP